MAVQDDPRLEKLLECLDATSMLSNVFTFPELKDAADDYDSLVNKTMREAQAMIKHDKDWTLPLNEVRKLYTVYWHLNYLRTDVAKLNPKAAKVWQQKQEKYLDQWKTLLNSKQYPEEIMMTFEEHACVIKPSELDQSLYRAKKPPFGGVRFTVCWHIAFLCNDLQALGEIGEKQLWESERLLYMPSIEDKRFLYHEVAQSYAIYLRMKMSRYERKERGKVNPSEYYIKCFRKHRSKQLNMRQNALKYVQKYELGEQD
jgi:hypothetical protein